MAKRRKERLPGMTILSVWLAIIAILSVFAGLWGLIVVYPEMEEFTEDLEGEANIWEEEFGLSLSETMFPIQVFTLLCFFILIK